MKMKTMKKKRKFHIKSNKKNLIIKESIENMRKQKNIKEVYFLFLNFTLF